MEKNKTMDDFNEDNIKKIVDSVLIEYKDDLEFNYKLVDEAKNNLNKLYTYQYENLNTSCKKELENLRSISKKFIEVPFNYEIDSNKEFHKRNTKHTLIRIS